MPHDMTEDQFLEAVTPAAAEAGLGERGGTWDLVHFAPGKMSKKRGRVSNVLKKKTNLSLLCRELENVLRYPLP